jgi:hypothetical protein
LPRDWQFFTPSDTINAFGIIDGLQDALSPDDLPGVDLL